MGSSVPGNTPTPQEQYAATTRKPMSELVRDLLDGVGPTLVAYMADVRSRQMPARWAAPKVAPHREAAKRLLLAHQVFMTVAAHENEDTARSWLIGANPRLSGESPASRIRSFDAANVYGAMQAFIEDTGGD